MHVLLSDGCALASVQAARSLAAGGHRVDVLSPDPRCLCRFSGAVTTVHPVPRYGDDPLGWFDVALDVAARSGAEVLLPTQEQAAVLSLRADRLAAAGILTAVPTFEALAQVQDKVSADATLRRLGLPRPPSAVITDRSGRDRWSTYPAFAKVAIATASTGVWRLDDHHGWVDVPDPTSDAPVLVEVATDGTLVMAQAVFARGELVAFAANTRARAGVGGGASHKVSVDLPEGRAVIERLGRALGWHGALSADLITTDDGPVVIDVNPRLVEPANAAAAGVDLAGTLLGVALGDDIEVCPPGRPGVRTHQTVLALLAAAERTGRRTAIARELAAAVFGFGAYRGGTEELTPVVRDPRSLVPVAIGVASVLARPGSWQRFSGSAVANYSLGAPGWRHLLAEAAPA
ncbi:MAG: hypothetical protein S0880_11135 [Actinomycetota bacterium]|nr:hypothetical protein [Actinomycetota bacterium]